MRRKYLLPLAALSLPLMVAARPAYPGIIEVTDPEGKVTEVRLFGDHEFNYMTDAEGVNILERDSKGYVRNAVRNGRQLKVNDVDLNLLRAEMTPMSAGEAYGAGQMRMAAINSEGRTTYPTIGDDIHALVVLLEYNDVPYTVPDIREVTERKCNEEGYSDYYSKGSARDYYRACSDGKFAPIFDVSEVVPLKHNQSYYAGVDNNERRNSRFGEAILEALEYLDERGTDFSKYDYDDDGIIDNIFFFYSGHGQADTADINTIWPHQGNYLNYIYLNGLEDKTFDGKKMRTYSCSCELPGKVPPGYSQPFLDGIGAFVHEYGHVIGLPDLYDTNNNGTKTPGNWSVMDHGSYNDYSTRPPLFSAYERWVCRWLEFTEAEDGTEYELEPLSKESESKAVRIRIRRPSGSGGTVRYYNEYYVLESRSQYGWDATLADAGLIIWHINFDKYKWEDNLVNSERVPRVEILECNDTYGYTAWPGDPNNGGHSYIYPGYLGTFIPNITNRELDVYLTDITSDFETGNVKFGYNMITSRPDDVTSFSDVATRNEATTEVYLKWKPVEGAEGYMLTVTRTDANGTVRYVDGLNDTKVGNVTEYTVRNISKTASTQTFNASVRVVKGIPSSAVSETYEFVPAELLTLASVGEISDDNAPIYGGNGCIVAPEGARAWSVSGAETSLDDVTPGLYIVKAGERVVKVMVK